MVPEPVTLELVAAGVELGAGVLVGGVEGDELVADKIVAGLDALGNGVLEAVVGLAHGARWSGKDGIVSVRRCRLC